MEFWWATFMAWIRCSGPIVQPSFSPVALQGKKKQKKQKKKQVKYTHATYITNSNIYTNIHNILYMYYVHK